MLLGDIDQARLRLEDTGNHGSCCSVAFQCGGKVTMRRASPSRSQGLRFPGSTSDTTPLLTGPRTRENFANDM